MGAVGAVGVALSTAPGTAPSVRPERRTLGGAGPEVSLVGLGTWGLGGLISRPITAEAAVALLRAAFERGITIFDSSDSYGGGRAEVLLGAAFSAAGDRERVVYVTKAGYLPGLDGAQSVRRWDANTSPDRGRWPVQDFSPAYLRWACELSLRRLQTDYIDAYLLHDPPPRVLRDRAPFDALRDLQREGKIRAYGVSSGAYGAALAVRRHEAGVVMAPLSLLETDAVQELLPIAAGHGAAVLARSPFGGGLLLDSVAAAAGSGRAPAFAPFDQRNRVGADRLEAAAALGRRLEFLRAGTGGSLGAAAMRYVLAYPQVTTVVVGIMSDAELEAALAAASPPYPDATLRDRAYATAAPPPARRALLRLARKGLWEGYFPESLAPRLAAVLARLRLAPTDARA
ncbi:MAG TPA: aldo/keto reductase, partial [Chloroflexota bacterium]|nr:aldo/keto reductase [Chloroflexota bacterium]